MVVLQGAGNMPFDGRTFEKVRPRGRGAVGAYPRQASAIGEVIAGFVESLEPPRQVGAVAEALAEALPYSLRPHCRVGALSNGCLKLVADGSSYVYELQLCSAELLQEIQRRCPTARLRRIEVGIAR